MSVEAVEELMADTKEAMEFQNAPLPLPAVAIKFSTYTLAKQEIANALAGKLTDEDEDAIMAELDELVQQVTIYCFIWINGFAFSY